MFLLLMAGLAAALVGLCVRYTTRHWDRGLAVRLRFPRETLSEGESGVLEQTVVNRKLLPFWWGDIRCTLPPFIRLQSPDYAGREYYRDTVSVFSYEQVTKEVPFTAVRRGYYCIGSAELSTQDFFFRWRMLAREPQDAELYVYPSRQYAGAFEPEFRRIMGDILTRRLPVEDPFQFRDIRDYAPFDSLKKINWKATARTGETKVNEFSATASQETVLLLDLDRPSDWNPEELREAVLRIGASLADRLLATGVPTGLRSNACDVVTGKLCALPCRGGAGQTDTVNRCLARMDTGRLALPFPRVLESLPAGGPQYLIVSCDEGPALHEAMERLCRAGAPVEWVLVRERGARLPGAASGGPAPHICEVTV